MFDMIRIKKYSSYFAMANNDGQYTIIGEWYISGEIQRGTIENGVWHSIPFGSGIEVRSVDSTDSKEQHYYIAIPKNFGPLCIALVQEITKSTGDYQKYSSYHTSLCL